jgi:hypothetical protein
MVAKISTGKSIRGMLHYNENKVTAGEARLILSSGFAGDIEKMDFQQKLQRFQHLTELKPNVKTNAVHISLNFHSSENLDNGKLQQIAAAYMDRIGFGDQPFLVYRHDDAAHQHLHITTTNITAQAERIDLHDIGKKLSEPARKDLETEFNLVKAESKIPKQEAAIKQADPKQAEYGRLPTKQAINNVVTAVTRDYKFTSLAEYNAVLKCFNVVALRGAEHTSMFEKKGLMFSLLDQHGKQVGVPIRASSFYAKPTLRNLEQQFEMNNERRKEHKQDLKQRIDIMLEKYQGIRKETFEKELKKQGIAVNLRQNDTGLIFGITFIDHRNKTVFNGSDLGKAYTAQSITSKFSGTDRTVKMELQPTVKSDKPARQAKGKNHPEILALPKPAKLLDLALSKTYGEEGIKIPKRKKKRRKAPAITHEPNL